jgi:hypothetical protein
MNSSNRRIVLGAALTLVALVSDISPASAMGRSTTSTAQGLKAEAIGDGLVRTHYPSGRTGAALQVEMETLRKELADLRAKIAAMQQVAYRD